MVLRVDFCFKGEAWIVGVVTILSFAKKDNACFSCTDWPLKLLVHVHSDGKNYSYTPRSDFHLSVGDLPYLIVEVQSEKAGSDRYRMLLQAACLARLGNGLNPTNPFIVTALYIESSGLIQRYLVFLPNPPDSEVCI
jgi:hypothetical protein